MEYLFDEMQSSLCFDEKGCVSVAKKELSEREKQEIRIQQNASQEIYASVFPANCYDGIGVDFEVAPGVPYGGPVKSTLREETISRMQKSDSKEGGSAVSDPPALKTKRNINEVLKSNGREVPKKQARIEPMKHKNVPAPPKLDLGKNATSKTKAFPMYYEGPVMDSKLGTMYHRNSEGQVRHWPGHTFLHPGLRRVVFVHTDGHYQELDPDTRLPNGRVWPRVGESEEEAQRAVKTLTEQATYHHGADTERRNSSGSGDHHNIHSDSSKGDTSSRHA